MRQAISIFEEVFPPITTKHIRTWTKKVELFHLWYNRVDTPLVDTVNQNFIYIVILYTFSQH